MLHLNNIDIIYILKTFIIDIYIYYTFCKILNIKNFIDFKFIIILISTFFITYLCIKIEEKTNYSTNILFSILLTSLLYSLVIKINFGYSILVTVISVSINYVSYFIAMLTTFFPSYMLNIENDFVNLSIIMLIDILLIYSLFRKKKFKNGFIFLQNKLNNEYFNILILNICVIIIFSFILLVNFTWVITEFFFFYFIAFAIIAFITIQKTFTMYYKHKLLVTELNETKEKLEKKNDEIIKLEAENLEYSKTAHSIAHKQKSLEHKLNKLMLNTELANDLDLRDRLDDISKEYSNNDATTPIPKTEIEIIDDMISCMASECKENNIDFELQLSGNIHHMINNLISTQELEILLADHIKDAVIAINHSDNINKSILVKLGLFNGDYLLSIYDSGIEFEIETLLDLGLKPLTTHKDDGGTGMGFMNTFDTLRKYNASLYINELDKPSKENYTKSVAISFNNKNEYKVSSYRANEIKEKNNRTDLIIE